MLLLVDIVESFWIFKKKNYKIYKNKNLFKYLNYVLIGHKKNWQMKKNKIQKDFWKQDLILTFQKFIITI
jgi:hypothetical protein